MRPQLPDARSGALLLLLLLAACAPADLDVTPTAVPTNTPTLTPTPQAMPTLLPQATPAPVKQSLVELLVENTPFDIPAGAIQWRRNDLEQPVRTTRSRRQCGEAKIISLRERQGGKANLTYGVFDNPEEAQVCYEFIRDLRTVLETGEQMEDFPQPNLFGSGTYGSNAIVLSDNIFLEVSVEQFSSTAGNPLPGLARQALRVIRETVASQAAEAEMAAGTDLSLAMLLEALPDEVMLGERRWERGPRSLDNVAAGEAVRVPFIAGPRRIWLHIGLFGDADAAEAYAPEDSVSRAVFASGDSIVVVAIEGESAASPAILGQSLLALADLNG